MGYYRTVSRKQGLGITTLDMADLRRRENEQKIAKLESEKLAKDLEEVQKKIRMENQAEAVADRITLETYRGKLLNQLHQRLPELILQESFSNLFKKSLVHDNEYIEENDGYINTLSSLYMRKLGGISGLRSAANRTNSPFLQELLEFCTSFGKEITMEKMKETMNQKIMDEKELENIISINLDSEQKEIIDKKMDRMGADELATMVSNKVVDVVRDEQQREKDLEDTEKHMVDDMAVSTGDDIGEDDATASEESTITIENYNPITKQFTIDPTRPKRSFFFSLMCGIANRSILDSVTTEGLTLPKKEVPQLLLENPLNINIFDVYIQDKNEDLYDLSKMDMADRPVIASTNRLDKDYILSEAVLQYTMFELAHTMKLINVTPTTLQQQSDFLVK